MRKTESEAADKREASAQLELQKSIEKTKRDLGNTKLEEEAAEQVKKAETEAEAAVKEAEEKAAKEIAQANKKVEAAKQKAVQIKSKIEAESNAHKEKTQKEMDETAEAAEKAIENSKN